MNNIKGMALHDCTLKDIKVNWKEKSAIFTINMLYKKPQLPIKKTIEFIEVTQILIPRKDSWGSSGSIYEIKYQNNGYLIQMQSGDVIEISCNENVSIK
ncbi:hypothetical protein [Desulfopila sp. IMCC35008]|uniref:hypothetical protein n=1 Tax=Desulfopila sp. IMCC35008 TaxID=2653858 RepID=UPI0013D1032E|nr:hypothetical protein [Desulfopila sp. IMCC35008]